jgi:hypothetical protein
VLHSIGGERDANWWPSAALLYGQTMFGTKSWICCWPVLSDLLLRFASRTDCVATERDTTMYGTVDGFDERL